jgi:hypothetical protein
MEPALQTPEDEVINEGHRLASSSVRINDCEALLPVVEGEKLLPRDVLH